MISSGAVDRTVKGIWEKDWGFDPIKGPDAGRNRKNATLSLPTYVVLNPTTGLRGRLTYA